MKFLDQKTLLEAIQSEINGTQLTFQTVDTSVLSFSMQLPYYLNTPHLKSSQNVQPQVSDLDSDFDLLSSILVD